MAFISPHIGDLDNIATCLALEETVDHLRKVLAVQPQAVAHDLNPDFFSTQLALQLGQIWSVPSVAVQHHHAHIAAILAEHGIDEPVLGLALDGVGHGDDGMAWGGELLRVDSAGYERLGHLRSIALPGGDRAAREPWRMAASALNLLGRGEEIAKRFDNHAGSGILAKMLSGKTRTPMTSSLGRWIDAAAGLLGVQMYMSFEGQAAMRLEGMAAAYGPVSSPMLHEIRKVANTSILDLAPLLAYLSNETNAGRGAAVFHASLTVALADWVEQTANSSGIRIVACGGGCFLNAILTRDLRIALRNRGLVMVESRAVPPGDGGLSLGQAWVARAQLSK